MKMLRVLRKLSLRRRLRIAPAFSRVQDDLQQLTEAFCSAKSLRVRTRRLTQLSTSIWTASTERRFIVRLLQWIRLMEQDPLLRQRFQVSWDGMAARLDSVPLLAETGLPAQNGLLSEAIRRIVQRVLPSARMETDVRRVLEGMFPTSKAMERFLGQQNFVYERLVRVFYPGIGTASELRMRGDIQQAMCLLAARVSGIGATTAMRQRGTSHRVETSPFYQLIFVTEALVHSNASVDRRTFYTKWTGAVKLCFDELEEIHLHMEDAGVSSALVYDLRSIEATLKRMRLLALTFTQEDQEARNSQKEGSAGVSTRTLIDTLLRSRLNDVRLRPLFHENLNLLARKTVERTGHGGEHYIAHTRGDYWKMWRAAAGGGLLTVFTAAIKMKLVERQLPLAVEGFLIGTDYAFSFVVLQILGFALATKQPSMTAAALAGIVRDNRGMARWSRISEFAADISRTQIAAAISNVLAVCIGAVAFEKVWSHMFRTHYLPVESAQHVYQTLHPFTSGTAIFAAFTGVLLWLAAVTGGWFENFAVYHRIPEAIAQHPLGTRFGARSMRRAADWLENNAASWSTSIVLGYLLGFAPVVARFFGVPLDVRHVTLSTGTLALAVARFGTSSFGHGWFYYAIAGIAITFVLNLGVSFSIASVVALRAYDVPRHEQMQILSFLMGEIVSSPLSFLLPVDMPMPSISSKLETDRQ
jgi:site-specific recombinase